MVTPLSLIYIGIVLHDAGLKSMSLNKDSIGGIIGRFRNFTDYHVLCYSGLAIWSRYRPRTNSNHYLCCTMPGPVIAVLPIVANESKSDLPFGYRACHD